MKKKVDFNTIIKIFSVVLLVLINAQTASAQWWKDTEKAEKER